MSSSKRVTISQLESLMDGIEDFMGNDNGEVPENEETGVAPLGAKEQEMKAKAFVEAESQGLPKFGEANGENEAKQGDIVQGDFLKGANGTAILQSEEPFDKRAQTEMYSESNNKELESFTSETNEPARKSSNSESPKQQPEKNGTIDHNNVLSSDIYVDEEHFGVTKLPFKQESDISAKKLSMSSEPVVTTGKSELDELEFNTGKPKSNAGTQDSTSRGEPDTLSVTEKSLASNKENATTTTGPKYSGEEHKNTMGQGKHDSTSQLLLSAEGKVPHNSNDISPNTSSGVSQITSEPLQSVEKIEALTDRDTAPSRSTLDAENTESVDSKGESIVHSEAIPLTKMSEDDIKEAEIATSSEFEPTFTSKSISRLKDSPETMLSEKLTNASHDEPIVTPNQEALKSDNSTSVKESDTSNGSMEEDLENIVATNPYESSSVETGTNSKIDANKVQNDASLEKKNISSPIQETTSLQSASGPLSSTARPAEEKHQKTLLQDSNLITLKALSEAGIVPKKGETFRAEKQCLVTLKELSDAKNPQAGIPAEAKFENSNFKGSKTVPLSETDENSEPRKKSSSPGENTPKHKMEKTLGLNTSHEIGAHSIDAVSEKKKLPPKYGGLLTLSELAGKPAEVKNVTKAGFNDTISASEPGALVSLQDLVDKSVQSGEKEGTHGLLSDVKDLASKAGETEQIETDQTAINGSNSDLPIETEAVLESPTPSPELTHPPLEAAKSNVDIVAGEIDDLLREMQQNSPSESPMQKSFLPSNTQSSAAQEIRSLLMDEPVYIYTSLAGGGYHMPSRTNRLAQILSANQVEFTYRDLGTDDDARKVWKRYGRGRVLPAVVRGKDDIVGNWEEMDEANEDYRVRELIYETL
ncbi:LANO_0G13696g1_1 [Lachancea nothofagi CBS 11611]|uniref:LANO_0G13696g1_1 n=1 Tax=Lachancea nothofagi CBS 11611 TaxID=1266666 RepID=A0A1G4KK56_9SACH|nr:LANO_0G13696g1_1 [Lachancea nothofagi CBS 11611]